MKKVIERVLKEIISDNKVVICTVIETRGPVPRGVGTKMLYFEDGTTFGTIGGGSLELAVSQIASDLIENNGDSCIEDFTLKYGEDGVGMICGGDAAVSFYVADAKDKDLFLYVNSQEKIWFVQYITDGGKIKLGICEKNELKFMDAEGFEPETMLKGFPALNKGNVSYYTEPVNNTDVCRIFGGGHVGQALVPVLAGIGFSVYMYDDRENIAVKDRFPLADNVELIDYKVLPDIDMAGEYIVVITHGHESDFEVLCKVLKNKTSYVGCIGSRKKAKVVRDRLKDSGYTEEELMRIHSPIGLDIGAQTPQEIAISIAAELIKTRAFLKRE